jgi:hypothetical protein
MRSIVIVAAMALGIGLVGIQTSSAAPALGTAIQNAAHLNQGTEQVQYGYGYGYRRYGGYGYGGYRGYGYGGYRGYRGYGYGYRRGYY